MLCTTFTSSAGTTIGLSSRSATSASLPDLIRVTLNAGTHVSFDVGSRERVDVLVTGGSVWLTEDAQDHLLNAASSIHACGLNRRVVISALSDAVIEFRRDGK